MLFKDKRIFSGILCSILLLALTNYYVAAQTPTIAAVKTQSATSRATTVPTKTNTPAPTSTPTNTPIPCTDDVIYIADVTIPDNTALEPGEQFDKTWRVKNTGACAWSGYNLTFVSGDRMSGPESQPVSPIPVGDQSNITVPMVAPDTPGHYQGIWKMTNASGEPFGHILTVVIRIRGAETIGSTWTRPADGMEMVYTPAGEFQMGSNDGDDDEKPAHTVVLDAFWLDRTEVTNAQYQRCVEIGACNKSEYVDDSKYNSDKQPVSGVDWNDAQTYCQWAGARLPTEAEWEYAARGPEGRIYPWGNIFEPNRGSFYGAGDGYKYTAPVGSFSEGASWIGALDLAGNVWEWVADWYGPYPAERQVNPEGPISGDYRVLRGGSRGDLSGNVRSSDRYSYIPGFWIYHYYGFRCAMNP